MLVEMTHEREMVRSAIDQNHSVAELRSAALKSFRPRPELAGQFGSPATYASYVLSHFIAKKRALDRQIAC
jgi:hypothetical protein